MDGTWNIGSIGFAGPALRGPSSSRLLSEPPLSPPVSGPTPVASAQPLEPSAPLETAPETMSFAQPATPQNEALLKPASSLESLLMRFRLITSDQLDEALRERAETGKDVGAIVVERGWVNEDQLARLLSYAPAFPAEAEAAPAEPVVTPPVASEPEPVAEPAAQPWPEPPADPRPALEPVSPFDLPTQVEAHPVYEVAPLPAASIPPALELLEEPAAPVEPEPEPEPETAPEPAAEAEPLVFTHPEPAADPEPAAEIEPLAEIEPVTVVETTSFEPAAEAELVAPIEPPVEFAAPATPEPEVEPEPATEPELEVALEPEPATEPELEAAQPQPEPTLEPELEVAQPGPPPAAAQQQVVHFVEPAAIETIARVFVRLSNGERVEAGSFDDIAAAKARAEEVVRDVSGAENGWPFFGGRYIRPEAIVSVDVDATVVRYE